MDSETWTTDKSRKFASKLTTDEEESTAAIRRRLGMVAQLLDNSFMVMGEAKTYTSASLRRAVRVAEAKRLSGEIRMIRVPDPDEGLLGILLGAGQFTQKCIPSEYDDCCFSQSSGRRSLSLWRQPVAVVI